MDQRTSAKMINEQRKSNMELLRLVLMFLS